VVVQQAVSSRSFQGQLAMPVRGAIVTQPFGCTTLIIEPWSSLCPSHHFHTGVDLAAPLGTVVVAANSGRALVERMRGGYGLYVIIVGPGPLSTLYGHLEYPLVGSGEEVLAGEPIGLLGSTGNSTGPHVHFEVRIDGVPVNPAPYLDPNPSGGDALRPPRPS
jgi:murein DD-endopeptidase MepM/ murein hydrolase activator NlpD